MTKPRHVAALTRFDKERDPNHAWYPCLPEEPGIVHSFRGSRIRQPQVQPEFLDSPISYERALCGATVKVILPTTFQLDDTDACQRCVTLTHKELETGVATPGTLPLPRPSTRQNDTLKP